MLALTGMDRLLEEHAYDTQGRPLAIFGDGAYQLGAHVLVKFDGYPNLPEESTDI
ncbi:hypothetical protein EC957_006392 [Mortierella hygrophila]|uniref:Uncharacterized protein n=1 Tax=Mortierella hygrophila TaxID=979708 RepID=A0A9P6JZ35_9FUNG|nr:hypothetical protein EC957_006392 [Mortierella hygrophila]